MLVYSCLHCLLFKNEKEKICFVFKVQCFPYFHDKTRSRVGSSVPSLNRNSRSEHDCEFELLAATFRSFKMLIDYILDLTPHLLPLPPIPPSKEREDEEIA